VPAVAPNLCALPELAPLLREELERVSLEAMRRPSGRALLVQACADCRQTAVDAGRLVLVRQHLQAQRLTGAAHCDPRALPWEDAAFQLVVAQHVGDALGDSEPLVEELVRVLAPGGVILWFGFNPLSPWLARMRWKTRGRVTPPQPLHADRARQQLLRQHLAPAALDWLGPSWPLRVASAHLDTLVGPLRAAYLITATRELVTPLALRRDRRREQVVIAPPLAVPSRRACA